MAKDLSLPRASPAERRSARDRALNYGKTAARAAAHGQARRSPSSTAASAADELREDDDPTGGAVDGVASDQDHLLAINGPLDPQGIRGNDPCTTDRVGCAARPVAREAPVQARLAREQPTPQTMAPAKPE
jgi:hypothetical protein